MADNKFCMFFGSLGNTWLVCVWLTALASVSNALATELCAGADVVFGVIWWIKFWSGFSSIFLFMVAKVVTTLARVLRSVK